MTFWYGQVLDRIRSIAILFCGFIFITTSSSCTKVGTAIGAGARAGLAIAEERSIRTVISDTALKLAVNKGLVESSFENLFCLGNKVRFCISVECYRRGKQDCLLLGKR